MKRITAVTAVLTLMLSACGEKQGETGAKPLENCAVEHEKEFGGVYIKTTIDDFNKLGYTYGDSVNIIFSSGYELKDIPYYNGYYVDAGKPLLIAYPGYPYIKAGFNYGEDMWETADLGGDEKQSLWLTAGMNEKSTATVTLNEKGKYRDIQEARDISYTDFRKDYPSDEVFANFRSMTGGRLKKGILYRSASPCDNQHNRAPYADSLIAEAGVRCILNLSDNEAKIEKYISADGFDSPYFLSLYKENNVIPLALNMNFYSAEFTDKIIHGFKEMTAHEGPYLVHCTEGKDRTGFVCMLIEALAGADWKSIEEDYMVTYDNYYKINMQRDPKKYQTILDSNLVTMVKTVAGDENIDYKTADLSVCARNYLIKAGMSSEEIDAFLQIITE